MINAYKSYNKTVKELRSDSEKCFTSTTSILNSQGVQLKQSPPGHHEHKCERAVKVLRERIRAIVNSLPFKLPPALYPALVMEIITVLNMTANKHTGVKTPRELVVGVKVNYKHDLRAPFGTVGLFKVPNQSGAQATESRVQVGIVVGRDLNTRGSVKVYLVESGQVVNRNHFQQIKATDGLIKAMNENADKDLKIQSEEIIEVDYDLTTNGIQREQVEVAQQESNEDLRVEETILPTHTSASSVTDNSLVEVTAEEAIDNYPIATGNDGAIQPSPEQEVTAVEEETSNPETIPETNAIATTTENTTASQDTPPEETTRYSLRDRSAITKPSRFQAQYTALNLSVKQALKLHGKEAKKAIAAEFKQLIDRKVWKALRSSKSAEHSRHKRILPCSMFVKEKFDAQGIFEKLKARLVAGGHRVETELYSIGEKASPTISFEVFMIVLNIAAYEKRNAEAIDFPGAYLNAVLKDKQLMRISSTLADIAVEVDRDLNDYRQSDGSLLVEIHKALYGLPESAKLWYDHLKDTLLKLGYRNSEVEPCLFNKERYGEKSTLCIHVDDVMHTYSGTRLRSELMTVLKNTYSELKIKESKDGCISYLGMLIEFNHRHGSVSLSMPAYIKEILCMFDIVDGEEGKSGVFKNLPSSLWKGKAATPASSTLFDIDPSSKEVDKTEYASVVMKVMYLANRVRPDLKLSLGFLATRAKDPREEDIIKLARVIKYIRATENLLLTLRPDELRLYGYVDASYAIHQDAKGHTGIVISMSRMGGPIYAKSIKQKLVSRSSTESELIGLTECVGLVLWLRNVMASLNYSQPATIVFEDNQSTITMAKLGRGGKTGNSKHIDVRFFFAKQHIDKGEIEVQHIATEDQVADVLTKPLQGNLFRKHRNSLLNQPSIPSIEEN